MSLQICFKRFKQLSLSLNWFSFLSLSEDDSLLFDLILISGIQRSSLWIDNPKIISYVSFKISEISLCSVLELYSKKLLMFYPLSPLDYSFLAVKWPSDLKTFFYREKATHLPNFKFGAKIKKKI